MKMGQKMRQVIALYLLLCPILTGIQAQNTIEEIQASLEILDCTETTCYNIKRMGLFYHLGKYMCHKFADFTE
ncbi:uncharacterized protein LOC143239005 isoform X2 [Tachypleus tridentatus]|uniref:uncharacterized protein LOC143239005 isoform X2 n=1 Tax=Tachypleus tridentatus TaxID=6853 RepID=UPI003FD312D9